MPYIKIDNDYFEIKESSIEFTTGVHATIYICFDITAHKQYLTHFTKMYEEQKVAVKKFTTVSNEFQALGCIIKSIDTNFHSNVNLTLRCDLLNLKDVQTRRDEIIEDILSKDQTSDSSNNIN